MLFVHTYRGMFLGTALPIKMIVLLRQLSTYHKVLLEKLCRLLEYSLFVHGNGTACAAVRLEGGRKRPYVLEHSVWYCCTHSPFSLSLARCLCLSLFALTYTHLKVFRALQLAALHHPLPEFVAPFSHTFIPNFLRDRQ